MLYRFSRDSTDRGCTDQGGAGLIRATSAEQGQGNVGLDRAQAGYKSLPTTIQATPRHMVQKNDFPSVRINIKK